MSNLDPIWDAYKTLTSALKVVRRCSTLGTIDPDHPFGNTRFYHLHKRTCAKLLGSAQQEIEDQTVLSLYAAFEASLRDHLAQQAQHLRQHSRSPSARFGKNLAKLYTDQCGKFWMDMVVNLFASRVGEDAVAQTGSIRNYRHWIAHGRRGPMPPSVSPQFAYEVLTRFLRRCRLA
jgi:hypothetical protein